MHFAADPKAALRGNLQAAGSTAAWALMASAMVIESDVYRYVAIPMAIYALTRHSTIIKQVSRDWLAILCYLWAAYVLARFVSGIVLFGEKGASEWLYAFPALFPLLGVAIYAAQRYLFAAATTVLVGGLIALLATLDLQPLIAGQRSAPLFHHNPIHAAVGCAILFISSLFWLLYAAETGRLAGRRKWFALALGISTGLLSLIGVLGAQSKGVWVALAITMAFIAFLSFWFLAGRWRLTILSILVASSAICALLAAPYVDEVAGPTIAASEKALSFSWAEGPSGAMLSSIQDPDTPASMRERLMLWFNALELTEAAPFFGWGNLWLSEWRKTSFASSVSHTLLHNGYLEILVRHGLFGITFLAVFAVTAAVRLQLAHRSGSIATSTTAYLFSISFFFFFTIATNSNNRLALGESFFLLVGGAVFVVTLLNQLSEAARLLIPSAVRSPVITAADTPSEKVAGRRRVSSSYKLPPR